MNKNFLGQLSPDFWLLKLQILSIEDNFLVNLPQSLSKCIELKELYIYKNYFVVFPKVILLLKSLKFLSFQCFEISKTLKLNDDYLPNLKYMGLCFRHVNWEVPFSFRLGDVENLELIVNQIVVLDLSKINLSNSVEFILKGNITKLIGNFQNFYLSYI